MLAPESPGTYGVELRSAPFYGLNGLWWPISGPSCGWLAVEPERAAMAPESPETVKVYDLFGNLIYSGSRDDCEALNGSALIEKDFGKIIKDHQSERSLHNNRDKRTPEQGGDKKSNEIEPFHDLKPAIHEVEFLRSIRTIFGSESDPIPPEKAIQIIRHINNIYEFKAAWNKSNAPKKMRSKNPDQAY